MNTIKVTCGAAIVAMAAVLLLSAATPAAARPEPEPTPVTTMIDRTVCSLTRIGTQYTRCDDLTGLGLPAPAWIPEQ